MGEPMTDDHQFDDQFDVVDLDGDLIDDGDLEPK